MGIPPDVDDIAEITVGIVKGVADLLAAFYSDAASDFSLLVANFFLLLTRIII